MMSLRNLFGLRCRLQNCPHVTTEDANGIWGQCIWCGHRAGYMSRAELRSILERDLAEYRRRRDRKAAGMLL